MWHELDHFCLREYIENRDMNEDVYLQIFYNRKTKKYYCSKGQEIFLSFKI